MGGVLRERAAQALRRTSSPAAAGALECAPGRLQLYVDDPVLVPVPPDFIETLSADLVPFLAGTGHISEEDAQRALGRCGRLAYLIPAVRPLCGETLGGLGRHRQVSTPRPPRSATEVRAAPLHTDG